MNVFNHLLPDDSVLGIGPLRTEPGKIYGHDNEATWRYCFELHLVCHTITVHSDYFRPRYVQEHKEQAESWKLEYQALRNRIAKAMGDDQPANLEVEELHETTKDYLKRLFQDLTPVNPNTNLVSLNKRINIAYELVGKLKKLALR